MTNPTQLPDPSAEPAGARPRYVGQRVPRFEDEHLVTGRGRWADNVHAAGELHLAILRSPVAHARVVRVDVSAAAAADGVVAAYAGSDLRDDWVTALPVVAPSGTPVPDDWPLKTDKVRYVGDPIAAVVATSAAAAADALELIDVELDPLPAVMGLDDDAGDGTLIHDELGTNRAFTFEGVRVGDIEQVIEEADVVVRRSFVHPRVHGAALEPRASMVVPTEDGGLTVHTSTQAPHRIRDHVALMLGLESDAVRVVSLDIGGGFGPKLDCYAEELLCATVARRLGQPVRHLASRSEDFQSTHQGRAQVSDLTVAARSDGTLLALDVNVRADIGGYLARAGMSVPLNGNRTFPGSYRWQAYRFDAVGYYTNAVPTAAYRGAGRPEAAFGVERMIDEVAAEIGMDPAELRRRNFPAPDEFPFESVGGLTYDSGDYEAALDAALAMVDYPALRDEQRRRRDAGDAVQLGVGICSFIDRAGAAPGVSEFGRVRVDTDGVEVVTGLGPTGQGTVTSLMQIVADELGVDIDEVRVVHGDTALVPEGKGTFGSRSMAVGAVAVLGAARLVADEARRRAAARLEAAVDDIEFVDGACVVRGSPDTAVRLFELAGDDAMEAEERFDPPGLTYPSGTHVAVAEVDTETGKVTIRRFVAVNDFGTAINPMLLDGQLHGGIAQGIGEALFEEAAYDAEGNLLGGTLIDYLLPGAPDLPHLELGEVPTTPAQNPLGAKGVGEHGVIGAPPAVVNAVADALRHLGVVDVPMPATPLDLWQAIEAARLAESA